jgi:hypothetical protein
MSGFWAYSLKKVPVVMFPPPPPNLKKTTFEHALIEMGTFSESSFESLPHSILGCFVGC